MHITAFIRIDYRGHCLILSFALNYKLGGMDVFGFHVVNFIIHYLAAVFLFLFIYNTLKLPLLREKYSHDRLPGGAAGNFFLGIKSRSRNFCYLYCAKNGFHGGIILHHVHVFLSQRPHISKISTYSISFFILCFIAGFAAVLSKENAAMLPVSILLFDLFLIQGVN